MLLLASSMKIIFLHIMIMKDQHVSGVLLTPFGLSWLLISFGWWKISNATYFLWVWSEEKRMYSRLTITIFYCFIPYGDNSSAFLMLFPILILIFNNILVKLICGLKRYTRWHTSSLHLDSCNFFCHLFICSAQKLLHYEIDCLACFLYNETIYLHVSMHNLANSWDIVALWLFFTHALLKACFHIVSTWYRRSTIIRDVQFHFPYVRSCFD